MTLSKQETNDMIQEAHSFKFSAIPFKKDSKMPNLKNWSKIEEKTCKFALDSHVGNIGIRTGKWSNIIIIDCDRPRSGGNNIDGVKEFQKLLDDHDEIKTVCDRSGSYGVRYYFKYIPNVKYNNTIEGKNIDILADNKCAVYPGSLYPGCDPSNDGKGHKCSFTNAKCEYIGNKYEWINSPQDYEIKDMPEWLKTFVLNTKSVTVKIDICYDSSDKENVQQMLKMVNDEAWNCDYSKWRTIIWTLIKLGFTYEECLEQSQRATQTFGDVETSLQNLCNSINSNYNYGYGRNSTLYKWVVKNLKDEYEETDLNPYRFKGCLLPSKEIKHLRSCSYSNSRGYANYFAECKKNKIKVTANNMYIYDDQTRLWKKSDNSSLFTIYSDYMASRVRTLLKCLTNEAEDNDELQKHIKTIRSDLNKINNGVNKTFVCDILKTKLQHLNFEDIIDNIPHLFPTKNGTIVDFEKGTTRERKETDYFSYEHPEFEYTGKDFEKAKEFHLKLADGNEELCKFLQVWGGYCLTGDIGAQKSVLLYGTGGNGKTEYKNCLMRACGRHFSLVGDNSLVFKRKKQSAGGTSSHIMSLMHKRNVFIDEPDKNDEFDEENFHKLTGDKIAQGRAIYKDQTEFVLTAKFTILSNRHMYLDPEIDANVDRLLLVHFTARFRPDPHMSSSEKRKLTIENKKYIKTLNKKYGNQLFNFYVYGAIQYYKKGLVIPDIIQKSTTKYFSDVDTIAEFLDTNCKKEKGKKEKTKNLWQRYAEINDIPIKKRKERQDFILQLIKRGYTKHDTPIDGYEYLDGIQLLKKTTYEEGIQYEAKSQYEEN